MSSSPKRSWGWRDWLPIFLAVGISSVLGALFDWSVWITLIAAVVLLIGFAGLLTESEDDPRRR